MTGPPGVASSPVVWRIAADDADGVREQLGRLTSALETEGETGTRTVGAGAVRLAIVDPTPRKLKLADRLVRTGDPWGGRSDIWFSPSGLAGEVGSGKVAFVFPGVEPTFGAEGTNLPELAASMGMAAPDVTEDTVAHRSAGIIRLGIFLDDVLRRCGVVPDLVAGHSIGEWSATVSAGRSTAADAEALISSVDLGAVDLPEVDFAALVSGSEHVSAALGDQFPDVEISHDNCGRQSVICGPPDRVAEAMAVLGRRNILGQVLDFRSGFHTSALLPAIDLLRGFIDEFPLRVGTTPIWSATTCAPLPADLTESREIMTRHLIETVRFRPMIENMYEAGARVFVQPGIGNLVGFIDDVLDGRPHAAIPVITTKRSAVAQLHRALTALWVTGVASDPSAAASGDPTGELRRSPASSPTPPESTASPEEVSAEADAPRIDARRATVAAGPSTSAAARSRPAPSRPPAAAPGVGVGARSPADVAPGDIHPVVAAAAGVLDNVSRATQDVVAAWSAAPVAGRRLSLRRPPAVANGRARASGTRPTPAAAGRVPVTPVVPAHEPVAAPGGPPAESWPAGRVTFTKTLSLDVLPETMDHRLYRQPDGWPDVSDTFPIVAMTTQLDLLGEIAREFSGGRDVIGLSDVRNYRWLDISDPIDIEVTVVPEGDDVLRISLGPYCRAKVRVGSYPAPARYEHAPLRSPRPAQKAPEDLWEQRLMFHGPRFHGIRALGPVGDDGIWGELEGMPDRGPLLDNVGKLIAYWVMEQRGWGEAPLPIGVDRVEYSGPAPEPGESVPIDVRITSMEGEFVVGEAVLSRPDGTTWCHIEGWRMHIFHRDRLMDPVTRWVEHHLAAGVEDDGLLLQHERWPGTPTRDLVAHQYLRRDEREVYEAMTPVDRRAWLVEAIGAKDAVRWWLAARHGRTAFPVETNLEPIGENRWRGTSPLAPGRELQIVTARAHWLVAVVAADLADADGPLDLGVDAMVVDEGDTPDVVAARLAEQLRLAHPDLPVAHRVLPPAEIGGQSYGHVALAWTVPPGPTGPSAFAAAASAPGQTSG